MNDIKKLQLLYENVGKLPRAAELMTSMARTSVEKGVARLLTDLLNSDGGAEFRTNKALLSLMRDLGAGGLNVALSWIAKDLGFKDEVNDISGNWKFKTHILRDEYFPSCHTDNIAAAFRNLHHVVEAAVMNEPEAGSDLFSDML